MIKARFNTVADFVIKWCIYAIVFAAPFSKSISEIAITAAIVFWVLKKVVSRDLTIKRSDLNIPFLIFIIAIIPSFFTTVNFQLSLKALVTKTLKFVALYFVVVDSLDSKEKLRPLFIVALVSAGLIMLDGFLQYFTGRDLLHYPGYPSFKARPPQDADGFYRGFPTACFPFPNDLAAWILLVIFPLASAVLFDLKKSFARYISGFVGIGLLILFFMTKARGAWTGFSISTIYMAISKRNIWLILLLVIAISLPFVLKMEMAQYIFAFKSVGDRFGMWGTSWEIFKQHPITGSGLNTFFVNFMKYRTDEWQGKKGSYAHNCYIQMACDVGLVGLGGFLLLILAYFISIVRRLGRIKDAFYGPVLWGMSIGVFAFLVHSFFDTNLYSLNLSTLFWTAIAVSQAVAKVAGEQP